MLPENQFWWMWGAAAATAAGTIFLGIVALWGDRLRRQFFPPRLQLTHLSREGEKARVRLTSQQDGKETSRDEAARYHHLRVSNARRWSVATRVQVYLLQMEKPAADGQFQIVWNAPVPVRWRLQEVNPVARDIGPPSDCDLCSVVKGKWLQIHPLIEPLYLEVRHREPTKLRLTMQAQSVEADSAPVKVEISWDGGWADGDREMTHHLVVTELPN